MGAQTSALCTGRRPRASAESMRRILVTNDDGYAAPGMKALLHALCVRLGDYGDVQIVVAAPDRERSASSHCVTTRGVLNCADVLAEIRKEATPGDGSHCIAAAFAINGTPVDCAQVAIEGTLFDTPLKFDLCISGVNLGHNAGTNVIYSGTLGAAREAAMRGVPSLAVSLDIGAAGEAKGHPFEHAATLTADIAYELVRGGLASSNASIPEGTAAPLWNINVPKAEAGKASARHPYPGIWLTRQSTFRLVAQFQLERTTSKGRELTPYIGSAVRDDALGTDTHALQRGWVSVTPVLADLNLMYGLPASGEQRLRAMSDDTRKLAHQCKLALKTLAEQSKAS